VWRHALYAWANFASFFGILHEQYWIQQSPTVCLDGLIAEMEDTGKVWIDEDRLVNC
jgi:hypothetical protein